MRNDVLHNPITADLFRMEEVGPQDGIKLMNRPGRPLLKLGRVQQFADQLREMNVKMHHLFERTAFA